MSGASVDEASPDIGTGVASFLRDKVRLADVGGADLAEASNLKRVWATIDVDALSLVESIDSPDTISTRESLVGDVTAAAVAEAAVLVVLELGGCLDRARRTSISSCRGIVPPVRLPRATLVVTCVERLVEV